MKRFAIFSSAIFFLASAAFAQEKKEITANEVIGRIKKNVGVEWHSDTVDTIKGGGDPNTKVTGIAVTMMATMDVLQRAVAKNENLIITHEPTFYDHLDTTKELPQGDSDPVYAEKRKFIEDHHLVVWRFHDHWHMRKPDGILTGVVKKLGWEKYQDAKNPYLFTIPETTVGQLSEELKNKLGINAMRVVADRDMKLKRLALSPGATGFKSEAGALEMPDIELLIVGETREWETVEYVADAIAQGRHKALIVLSHIPSEQPGMDECATWLKTFVTEVPVEFVPAKDPFAPLKAPAK
ncbi:MAG: Nif3-like dinuclear metal center hexameric protein [Acidobacteria bacterium]|nr:Nif3-like dinuclear metal center hexameric protein [Acidobacteriota bacterium]MBS1864779.1 Nif3-like dinuclear metal center hexameric protein [Acidobacteriota bacterium]